MSQTFTTDGDDTVHGEFPAAPPPSTDPAVPTPCPSCGAPRRAGRHGWTCVPCMLGNALADHDGAGLPGAFAGEESGRAFDHYELATLPDGSPWELGRGAMGITFKAQDTNLHCPVALKIIHRRLLHEPAVRERFVREARAAAGLKHPNVAAVHHLGTRGEEWFFAMEFIEGETLEAVVRREGPLGAAMALEVGTQVARALGAAERVGLVHRDIKPANLMLVNDPGTGIGAGPWLVKVIDFGVARSATLAAAGGADLTGGLLVGTPSFASPEQLRGEPTDFRSDAYSLGVTLWWALLGRTPFAGDSFQVVGQHLSKPPPFRELAEAAVPAPVVALLRRMLDKDPADRPQSAAALIEALARATAGLPPPASPAHRGRRVPLLPLLPGSAAATRWRTRVRRRWRRWVPVAAGAALAAGGLGVALRRELAWLTIPPAPTPPRSGAALMPAAEPLATTELRSLAVLPFHRSEGGDGDTAEARLAEGLVEDVTARLSKLDGLKVISPASTAGFRDSNLPPGDIATRLGVRGLLLGRVRQAGDGSYTIHAELLDAPDGGRVLWSETYDHLRPEDLALVQGRLSADVASHLRLVLTPAKTVALTRPLTENALAYDRYLRGRAFYNRYTATDMARAIGFFQQALELDPQFAAAYAALGAAYGQQYRGDEDPAKLQAATAAAREGIRLDPHSPEGHRAMGALLYYQARYVECVQSCQRALEANPNHNASLVLAAAAWRNMGRLDQAIQLLHRAVSVSPLETRGQMILAETLTLLDDDAGAEAACDRALALQPDHAEAHYARAYLELLRGQPERARAELAAANALVPPTTQGRYYAATIEFFDGQDARAETLLRELLRTTAESGTGYYQAMSTRSALACLRLRAGDDEEARKLLETAAREDEAKIERLPDSSRNIYDLAAVRALQGRGEDSLILLQQASAAGWTHYRATRLDPRFKSLAGDGRFKMLLEQWQQEVAQMRRAGQPGSR